MPKSIKSKASVPPAKQSAQHKQGKAVPGAHEGSADFIAMLEKVAPFLFPKKKKGSTSTARAVKAAKKPSAVKKKSSKKSGVKKTKKATSKKASTAGQSSKSARTVRKPATTLEVRKRVTAPSGKTGDTEVPKESDEGEAEDAVTDAASVQMEAKASKKASGVMLLPEEQEKIDAENVKASLLADGDDVFLGKVVKTGAVGPSDTKKASGWSLFKSRFISRDTGPKKKVEKTGEDLTSKDIEEDTFLQRVQKKNVNSVVGTAVDPDEVAAQKILGKKEDEDGGALEAFASGGQDDAEPVARMRGASATKAPSKGRILSAADLRKETQDAKEAAIRLEKEVKEIKEEMRSKQKDREKDLEEMDKKVEAKKEAEQPVAAVSFKKKKMKHKSGLQRFLAGVGHFGLGKERMRFVQNLATMLNAGLPLIDSLKTLQLETRAKPMRKLLQRVLDAVENGSPLWRAMEEQSFFSLHAIALIRIGEEAGNLAQNMEYLALQEEKDHELKSKVKMAMIYPTIVMVIMFIIVMGLGLFVLPNLIGVLYSLNVPLPFVTRMVILFTNIFTEYGAIVVPGSIAFFVLMVVLAKFSPLRGAFQWIMFHIPGIGALAKDATIARFGVILGGLLKAGVPVIDAMQSLVEVTPIVSYRKLYIRLLDHVSIGDSFSKSFAQIKGSERLLPPSVQQLVITGEKSGALADIMLKIADIYDKKASETAQKLPVILEPMLLLIIGGLVGTIAFAIIVPIYSIVGTVGR